MCEKPYTRADLEKLIKDLLEITEVPFQIKRQIREYYERGLTYKGIARAICYLIDYKHFDFRTSYQQYGIGIVKNVYAEAQNFYEQLKKEKEKQLQKQQTIIQNSNKSGSVIYCGRADTNKSVRKKKIDITEL